MALNNEADEMGLGDLVPGDRARVLRISSSDNLEVERYLLRLREMGFSIDVDLEMLGEAPISKDPIRIRIRDGVYALRRSEANFVRVTKI